MDRTEVLARRERLYRPPGGRVSSEIDIVPQFEFRRRFFEVERAKREDEVRRREEEDRRRMEMEAAWAAIFSNYSEPDDPRVTPRKILSTVAKFYRVTQVDIKSARREAEIVRPRHVVYYLCRTMTTWSYPAIGRFLGGRDHTTILHGSEKIKQLIPNDPQLSAEIEALRCGLDPSLKSEAA